MYNINLTGGTIFMEKTYSIKDAAAITGVTEKQLRNWEVQSFITDIERLQSGSRALRRYNEDQIREIKEIKKLINIGFTVSAASRRVNNNNIKLEDI